MDGDVPLWAVLDAAGHLAALGTHDGRLQLTVSDADDTETPVIVGRAAAAALRDALDRWLAGTPDQ